MGMQFSEDEVDEMIREVDVDGQLLILISKQMFQNKHLGKLYAYT